MTSERLLRDGNLSDCECIETLFGREHLMLLLLEILSAELTAWGPSPDLV